MLRLRRLFKLPSPVDLGWSEHDALGSREYTPYQEGKTWEDWHEHCQAHYPVRYFLAETLPGEIQSRIVWPAKWKLDWALDYTLPSRRQHLFDLRNIDPLLWYQHGYIGPDHIFWLAGWGALMRWHNSPRRKDPREWMSALEQAENQTQVQTYVELMELVHYWQVTRMERAEAVGKLHRKLDAIETTPENQEAYEAVQEEISQYSQESHRLEDEMWLRLAKARSHLWH